MGPWDGRRAESRSAEEPARVKGASAAGREGTRRSEKAKVSEEALLTWGSEAERPVNVRVHTYTRSETHNYAASGWRIHRGVEVTELSTNKQHTLVTCPGRGSWTSSCLPSRTRKTLSKSAVSLCSTSVTSWWNSPQTNSPLFKLQVCLKFASASEILIIMMIMNEFMILEFWSLKNGKNVIF